MSTVTVKLGKKTDKPMQSESSASIVSFLNSTFSSLELPCEFSQGTHDSIFAHLKTNNATFIGSDSILTRVSTTDGVLVLTLNGYPPSDGYTQLINRQFKKIYSKRPFAVHHSKSRVELCLGDIKSTFGSEDNIEKVMRSLRSYARSVSSYASS